MVKQSNEGQEQAKLSPSERKREKFLEARESLPEGLREVYDRLVDE